jgi:hypothetical protein
VDLASKIFGSLSGTRVLLVGAGKMGELAARHLLWQGAGSLTITNRTEERARALADAFGCSVLPFFRLRDEAHRFDIVITSTGSRVSPPLTPTDVEREVEMMCMIGELPRPTTIAESGRGLWLLWYLRDQKNENLSHLGCQPDVLLRYKDIHRAICAKLAHLGADRGAIDGARLTGLHGTLKCSSKMKVAWKPYPGGRRYTLFELSVLMGVSNIRSKIERESLLELRWTKRSGNVAGVISDRCKRGWRKSASNRIAAFTIIQSLRGGFSEGMRDKAMFMYALCLKSASIPQKEATAMVRKMGAAHCVPPLDASTCDARVRSAYENGTRYRSLTDQTLADWLEVTVEEAHSVSQQLSNTFPAAARQGSSSAMSNAMAVGWPQDAFPPATNDATDRLLISEKVYGREREIATLLAAFDRVMAQGTPELVLVSGYSGRNRPPRRARLRRDALVRAGHSIG